MNVLTKLLLCVVLISFFGSEAKSHEAVTGWRYPMRCCGEGDCAHAMSAVRNSDGSLTVTTQHGTATFPASFNYDESPDGLIHACFTPSTLYCLFLAAGI
jgi:hypothetical protein